MSLAAAAPPRGRVLFEGDVGTEGTVSLVVYEHGLEIISDAEPHPSDLAALVRILERSRVDTPIEEHLLHMEGFPRPLLIAYYAWTGPAPTL